MRRLTGAPHFVFQELEMAKSDSPSSTQRAEWHFNPELPIGNNPLFEWPLNLSNIAQYYRDYWLTLSEVTIFLILALLGWFAHQNGLFSDGVFSWGDVGQIYARNLVLITLVA